MADKERSRCSAVNAGDVALQVRAVNVQARAASRCHGNRRSCSVIVEPDIIAAGLFDQYTITFQRVIRSRSVDGLGSTVAIIVVNVADRGCAVRGVCQLAPLLPGEGEAVMVAERVSNLVVSDGVAVVGGQLVLPVTVTVGVRVRCRERACDSSACLVGVFLGACQVSTKIVVVNDGLVQIQVVFPDQLVQAVVVVFLSLQPSFRDRLDVAERDCC